MHPDPVPISTRRSTAGGRGRPPHTSEDGLNHVLGFRTGNENRGRDDEIHAPELLVPGDVLGGHAVLAFGQSLVVAALFLGGDLALGMSMEISAVACQREHEQEFGIHPRRRDACGSKAGDGRG